MHRTTRNRCFSRIALAGAAALFVAQPGIAADTDQWEMSDDQRARIEARFEEIRERLDLSEEQQAQLEPVLRKDFEQRAAVMRKHGMTREREERPGRRELRSLRRDLKGVREATDAEVEQILDDRQLAEYRKIREEAQDEMRERMRSRRQESER